MIYSAMVISGTIIGYDPGGNGRHGIAKLVVEKGIVREAKTETLQTAEQVIQLVQAETNLVGLGVDTLTCWGTGDSGWRSADRYLRERYSEVQNRVIPPNGLFGAMGLNGMAALVFFRTHHPDLFITETHPKVLLWTLMYEQYDYENNRVHMDEILVNKLGVEVSPANDHEWDAAISAYATLQGMKGIWKKDLHRMPMTKGERLIKPCGKTHYFWPE